MTKSELIANLNENNCLHSETESWLKSIIWVVCLSFVLLNAYYKFEGVVFDVIGWIAAIIFIWMTISGSRTAKNIDKKTSMHCSACSKRYDEETFAYAVLVNECQNCKNAIYET